MEDLDAVVQGEIDNDQDFQASIADLPDEDKSTKIAEKKWEVVKGKFGTLSQQAKDFETKFNDQRTRAEKAEATLKKKSAGGEEPPKKDDDALSTKDVLVLSKSNVHEDDIEYLINQRKATGKSISDLLKDDDVQVVLNARTEKRKTADAANVKPARPGTRKPDGSTLVKELESEGKVPEPGSDEAEELFWARRGGKPSK